MWPVAQRGDMSAFRSPHSQSWDQTLFPLKTEMIKNVAGSEVKDETRSAEYSSDYFSMLDLVITAFWDFFFFLQSCESWIKTVFTGFNWEFQYWQVVFFASFFCNLKRRVLDKISFSALKQDAFSSSALPSVPGNTQFSEKFSLPMCEDTENEVK